ncbi:MAG: hypothetical protein QM753_17665 [Thermomicrobiales bacterium]
MLDTLIRMKLALLRHSHRPFANWRVAVGLVLAIVTILLATYPAGSIDKTATLLMMAIGGWTLGWVLAPIQTGAGADEPLMPEHLALLPIAPRRLAAGLLATLFVGMGTVVTLLALLALPVFGAKLGPVAAIVGSLVMLLHLAMAVLLSRIVIGLTSQALLSRFGLEFAALQYAIVIALSLVGWVIPAALAENHRLLDDPFAFLSRDLPNGIKRALTMSPASWGVNAIVAADEHHWLPMLAYLVGLVAIIAVLVWAWTVQVSQRLEVRQRRTGGRITNPSWLQRQLPATPLGASAARAMLTWSREPRMALEARIAVLGGIFIVAIPAAVNWTQIVAWVGVIVLILGASTSCNLYGLEGSAFWMTLLTPGAIAADVRGKQIAYLLEFGPIALLMSLIATAWGEQWWAWTWIAAIFPAALGAGAGAMIVVSARGAVPVPEASRKSGNLVAAADNTAQTIVTILLLLVALLPTVAMLYLAGRYELPLLELAAIAVGVGSGMLAAWWGGRWTIGWMERNGPELLSKLRYG